MTTKLNNLRLLPNEFGSMAIILASIVTPCGAGGEIEVGALFEPYSENPLIQFSKPIGLNLATAILEKIKNG